MPTTAIPANNFAPVHTPAPKQRAAIVSMADETADVLCQEIAALRAELDAIEQQHLQNIARVREDGERLHDQLTALRNIVAGIRGDHQ